MELQLIGVGEVEAEHSLDTPLSPCCDADCTCVCHLQRPGMKLIWVPIDEEECEAEEEGDEIELEVEEEEEEELERGGEGESDEEEGSGSPLAEEREECVVKQNKGKFHHTLDVMIDESNRRRSDPGPQAILASLSAGRSHSPPIPPKRTQSPTTNLKAPQNQEEGIYEAILLVVKPTSQKTTPSSTVSCQELDIPLIKVQKPVRRAKLSSSNSDPTSEHQMDRDSVLSADDAPPTVPPRMPVAQDRSKSVRNLMPVHRGAIPLPQPTVEEWRALRPSSPNILSAGLLIPQRAAPPPPTSPLLPHRVPPQLPMPDPRSSASVQSITQAKGWY